MHVDRFPFSRIVRRVRVSLCVPAATVGWGLPVWAEDQGQWDAGVSYTLNDQFKLSFNVTNLTDVVTRQTQQQTMGYMPRQWFKPGRTYELTARYEF